MDDPLVHILGVKKDQTSWVEEEIVLTQNAWSPPEYGIIRCGRISMEMATLQKGQWLRSPVYILLKSVLWVFDNADRNRIPDFWNLMHMLIDFVFLIFFFWKTTQNSAAFVKLLLFNIEYLITWKKNQCLVKPTLLTNLCRYIVYEVTMHIKQVW